MAGRPAKEFDKKQFTDLVSLGCTQEEICWFFRDKDGKPANIDTLSRWCKRTYGLNFHDYRQQMGLTALKIQLRRNQLELSRKSAAMAIFLGKQFLGQRDNPDKEERDARLAVLRAKAEAIGAGADDEDTVVIVDDASSEYEDE